MQSVTVGIVGCGVIAPTHIRCYQSTDEARVTWACDLVEEKARAVAVEFGISNTTLDYRDLLADPGLDAISICTDHGSHAEIAVAALKAGKHVLCEKALAASTQGLQRMAREATRHPAQVAAGVFQHRFTPVNKAIRACVEGGRLGTLLTAALTVRCLRTPAYYQGDDWRGTWRAEGGSVLMNQAIHFIDLLAWLAGDIQAVSGWYDNLTHGTSIETEDTAVASVKFRNGAMGTIEATCSSHLAWEFSLALHGTLASIEIRNDQPVKVESASAEDAEKLRGELENARENYRSEVGKGHYGYGHPAQIADFVAAIGNGRTPAISFAQARHAVDVALAVYESCRTGHWVIVPTRTGMRKTGTRSCPNR